MGKMSKYIKELISLDNDLRNDKKLLKKVFSDKQSYYHFIQTNVEWILEKSQFEYATKEEVHGLMIYLQKNAQNIVQSNTKELANKFDLLIKRFV